METLNERLRNRVNQFQLVHDIIEILGDPPEDMEQEKIDALRDRLYEMNGRLQESIDFFVQAETLEDLTRVDE